VQDRAWAILPAKLDEISGVIENRIKNGKAKDDVGKYFGSILDEQPGNDEKKKPYQVAGGVAVISVMGTLVNELTFLRTGQVEHHIKFLQK